MRNAIVFEAERRGYGIDQIADRAMTVGELISILEDYDEDTLVVLSHDNGYTYGSLSSGMMGEAEEDEDGDWEAPTFREW